eukprot:TRINITY_DN7127_c0_g1_i1.p1 TRINITY_DN7127_c0_g1~~TRINITY_DN7127_c0_g1_i1.p1  ORF type:complete len:629 (+),score=217.14 TRINITY_DN7127_c0_g1_i1:109-1887(+)
MSDEGFDSGTDDIEYAEDEDEHDVEEDSDHESLDRGEFKELHLLQLECQLLAMEGYRAGYLATGLTVMVAFSPAYLHPHQLRACGLHSDKDIVFSLTFPSSPPTYLASSPSRPPGPERVSVRQSSDACLDNKQTLADSTEFGLWWTLEQVLTQWLREQWPELERTCREELERAQVRNQTLRWSQVQHVLALAKETGAAVDLRSATVIVHRTHGRLEAAQELMYDEDSRAEIERAAQSPDWYFNKPGWKNFSLLLACINYLKHRISIAAQNCIVCDKPHPIPLIKPVACDMDLCNFQMVNLGLGVNLEMELLQFPLVVDFLLCCAHAAAMSQNKYTHFPFEGGALTVSHALAQCPSVDEMRAAVTRGGKDALHAMLEDAHPRKGSTAQGGGECVLYQILRWIVASNRTHMEEVPPQQRVKGMTDFQFMLSSTTPQAEARFQELKRQCGGSFFAFHGSPLGSWHNILRGGLRRLELRTAYGPGIYFATNASTSLGYMTASAGFPRSKFGQSLRIMALCEVIDEGSEKKCLGRVHRPKCSHNTSSPHIRVEAEECVVTRILFLFTDTSSNCNLDARKVQEEARRVTAEFSACPGS